MATPLRRRQANHPDLYFEGYLEKRSFRDKASLKLWTSLCGKSMLFFNNIKDADYVEKLDLVDFKSVTDDLSRDQKLDAGRFNLRLKDRNFKFTAPSLEARELWKGYIHAVVELSVPKELNLLPGQIRDLHEAVEKEKDRRKKLPAVVPTPDVLGRGRSHSSYDGYLPECYMQVSRVGAELWLEREPKRGNLLLRPGGHGNTFAVTTRENLNGPVFKHYSVTQKPGGGFIIDLKKPIHCATLQDVITLMLKETGGALTPFIPEECYELYISFVESDMESGERSNSVVTPSPTPPTPPPKPAPRPASLHSDSSFDDDIELYLSEPEEKEESAAGSTPRHCGRPGAKSSDDRVEKTNGFTRPSNPPPPLPKNIPTTAVKPPTQRKGTPQSGTEDVQETTVKPVPTPRNLPPRSASSSSPRTMSNAEQKRKLPVSSLPRPCVALKPPTQRKGTPQSGTEDVQETTVKPVPTPRILLPRSASSSSSSPRTMSNVCGISEELKQVFLKKGLGLV